MSFAFASLLTISFQFVSHDHNSVFLPFSKKHCFFEGCCVNRSICVLQAIESWCCLTARLKGGLGGRAITSWAVMELSVSSYPLDRTDALRIQLSTQWDSGTIPSDWYSSQSGRISFRVLVSGCPGTQLHRLNRCVEMSPVSKETIQSSCIVAGSSQEYNTSKRWSGRGSSGGFRRATMSKPTTICDRKYEESFHWSVNSTGDKCLTHHKGVLPACWGRTDRCINTMCWSPWSEVFSRPLVPQDPDLILLHLGD